ncbi:Glycyl-tRNA synthetase alpha chain [Burkholderia anthina]|nr:Glycyl-tRNA synthetase alpha chain [Burkholderia anthina]
MRGPPERCGDARIRLPAASARRSGKITRFCTLTSRAAARADPPGPPGAPSATERQRHEGSSCLRFSKSS